MKNFTGQESWEVYFPHEILGKGWHESVVLVHEDAMKLCRLLTWELGEANVRKELKGLSDHLVQAECQRDWLESVLVRNQPECERYGSLRALSAEFPLNPECEGSGDQFLQTRTVGLSEARRELNLWKPPAAEEVNSLEVASQARSPDKIPGGRRLDKGGSSCSSASWKVRADP